MAVDREEIPPPNLERQGDDFLWEDTDTLCLGVRIKPWTSFLDIIGNFIGINPVGFHLRIGLPRRPPHHG